jgi:Family of unknown function (DUF5670)
MDLLWTVAIILIILWLLGMVSSYTLGGFVHILLVLAIIVILIRVIQGRRCDRRSTAGSKGVFSWTVTKRLKMKLF